MRLPLPRFLALSMLFSGITCYRALAQNTCGNLVFNGDFEQQNVSPISGTWRNIASGTAVNMGNELTGWKATNYSDPWYYATDTYPYNYTNPFTSSFGPYTPYNYDSSPNAHNGGVGLKTYSRPCCPDAVSEEYVMGTLTTALDPNAEYYGSMKVRTAVNSDVTQYANIGFDITPTDVTDYSTPSTAPYGITFTPRGKGIQSSSPITSTDWTTVSGTFLGIAGGRFINIGNFQPDTYTGTANYPPPNGNTSYAYVYIDQVEVYKIPNAGVASAIACGSSATIGENCGIPGATYSWTARGASQTLPSNSQIMVSPPNTTTYDLVVTLPNGATRASSVIVTVSGSPSTPGQIFGNPQVCYDRTGDGRDRTTLTINTPAPTGYSYYSQLVENATGRVVDDNLDGVTLSNGTFSYFLIGGNYTVGQYTLQVRYQQGTCYGAWQTRAISIISCTTQGGPCTGRGCDDAITAYPNPAAESLSLPAGTQEATLINSQGNVVQANNQANALDVHKLPDGLYNLRMKKGGKVINQRIQIKH
ncbi:T9SS type A sorting domain-containing protein [Hymenobacter cheonanensis]|uniref:T9SS type A sorting domain-containing protein n=1 Tax=Hymenobacter sp. CA2-7 TaxID=3063993 RepID=UPI002712D43F|nr:T9SS type A sorting domain-containing protein [Hymenobacter sp. CA2-7]MDO7885256.1 T9SS type A sorting domain-containing protein [Hymenobacter sp. CA2-7]